jgi:hypothetical protein
VGLEDRRRRGVGRRHLYRENLALAEPHVLQSLRPQDLSPQLAKLLQGRDFLDLRAHMGREAAKALGHQLEEHLPTCLNLPFLPALPAAFLATLSAAFSPPLPYGLFSPPDQVLFQPHGNLLQIHSLLDYTARVDPPDHAREPRIHDPSQFRLSRRNAVAELLAQIGQGLYALVDFDPEEGGGRVVLQLRAVEVQAALVEEEVGQPGEIPLEILGDRSEVRFQAERRAPAAFAVVEHQGENRGEAVPWLQGLLADDVFEQQADVGQEPHGHEGVGGRLELQQEVEVDPAVFVSAEPQAPDEIAVALAQVSGDEAGADPLQGGEIEPVEPVRLEESLQQLLDHDRLREDAFVTRVVPRRMGVACVGSFRHTH